MANFSDGDEAGVSLFPMFTVLACTLGVMVFVLATASAVSLGADKAVRFEVQPDLSGLRSDREPTWAEWDGRRLVLLPRGEEVVFPRDLAAIESFQDTYDYMFQRLSGTAVGSVLAEIAMDSERYLVVLVRPDGFGSLAEVRGYLDLLGADHLTEPIAANLRRIDVR
jgi:hypothetical protein